MATVTRALATCALEDSEVNLLLKREFERGKTVDPRKHARLYEASMHKNRCD